MLRSTLRQMASISGRTILAIGLTSATVLALAPSAKAGNPADSSGSIGVNIATIDLMTFTSTSDTGSRIALTRDTGVTKQKVGTLYVESNNVNGFTVKVTSTNAAAGTSVNSGLLKNGTYSIPYALQYNSTGTGDGSDVVFASGVATVLNITGVDANYSVASGKTADIGVTIQNTDVVNKAAGDYTDTLTFNYVGK